MHRSLITWIFIAVFLPCAAYALDLADEELALYFPFDEKGDVAKDWSPHGNDGVIVGDIELVEGKYGMAYQFEEDAEVKAPYIEINDRSFTVSMWVKPALAGGSEQCVFSQTQANATNTSLHYRIYTNGTVRMGFYSNDLDAPGAVEADEWVHICFWHTMDGPERRIYINGEQQVQDKGKSAYKGAAGDTIVGSWGATGQKFNGVIDEVQLWHRALSEQEIQDSMAYLVESLAVDKAGKTATLWAKLKN